MQKEFDIRDFKNKILLQAYEKDNYFCADTGADTNICYIFFSSNGLYYPNTEEVLKEQILEKDRYEWKWVAKNSSVYDRASRVIFVRDIYKCWYSRGISHKVNTIDKVLDLLKTLTEGYRVVTVGSSAGGYMAVLSAVKLNAEFCLNFSGQYHISENLENPYLDLTDLLKEYNGNIFYFMPIHYEADWKELVSVENIKCIKTFSFNENRHASTMLTGNMSYIIDKEENELVELYERFCGKEINKLHFLLITVPVKYLFSVLYREIRGSVVRRMGKHWNGI